MSRLRIGWPPPPTWAVNGFDRRITYGSVAAGRGLPRLPLDRGTPNANSHVDIEVADYFPTEWLAAPVAEDSLALVAA